MHHLLMEICCICCSVRVNFSIGHQTDISHEPCYNNHRTRLRLTHQCYTCYLTLYVVTATSKWTALPEAMHVLSVLCVPSRVGIDRFQPGTHLHSLPLTAKEP